MALMDTLGKLFKRPSKADLSEEISGPDIGSVRTIQSAHPADGLTPARLGALLREAETGDATAYLELAEQMEEKDLHYAAVLGVRKRAIRRLKLEVIAGDENKASEDAAALTRTMLASPTVKLALIDILDALGKSFSVHEILWNTTATPWTINQLKRRDPRWFRFDQSDGETLLLRSNEGEVPLAPFRFIEHRAKIKSGLPIRNGLARLVAWAYVFKNYTLKDWAIFMEAYGHPLRIGKHGPNATPEDKATLLRAVRRLGVDMAAVMPKSMEVDIVDGSVTNGDKMFESSARYWDEQISKAVLGQVSTTDAIAGGHAVGKVHNEVRDDIRDSDAEQLAATLMRDIAAPIAMLNFKGAACPIIQFVAEEDHDPRLTMAAIKMFGQMGMEISVPFARETFGIREPQEGEQLLTFATTRPEKDGPSTKVQLASAQGLDQSAPGPDSLSEMLTRLLEGQAEGATDPLLGGIVEALASAQSLEDVQGIVDQLASNDPDNGLQDLIARVLFMGRLSGETGADIGRT